MTEPQNLIARLQAEVESLQAEAAAAESERLRQAAEEALAELHGDGSEVDRSDIHAAVCILRRALGMEALR